MVWGKLQHETDVGHLCGKATGRVRGQACKLGSIASQNHQGEANGVSQVNGEVRFGACQCFHLWSCPYRCPASPCPEVSQFSFSLYVPGGFKAAASALEFRVIWFVNESVHGPTSVSSSPLSFLVAIHSEFCSQMLWVLLFSTLMSQVGEHAVGLGPLLPQWGSPQPRYPSQLPHMGVGPACSALLTSLDMASLDP